MSRSILITGCSSGIGYAAAKTLAANGYQVIASARKAEDVEMLKDQGLNAVLLDVNSSSSIQAAVHKVLEITGGTLDALFNNAGFVVAGAVEDLTRDMIRSQFETNVFGVIELTNAILPIMRKQGHGRIIMNTSLLAIVTMPFRGAYNASKFALEAFSSTLRQELYGTSIYVSVIAPGPIVSDLRENTYKIYQDTIHKNDSVHKNIYTQMEKNFFNPQENEKRMTLQPDAVVDKLIKALEQKHPKAHYYVGFPTHLFAWLRRLMPDSLLDWFIVKISEHEVKKKK